MPNLPTLFKEQPLPRRAPIKRMHVADAGEGILFECGHCGYSTDWIVDNHTLTENKRGLPCPKCNPDLITQGDV